MSCGLSSTKDKFCHAVLTYAMVSAQGAEKSGSDSEADDHELQQVLQVCSSTVHMLLYVSTKACIGRNLKE